MISEEQYREKYEKVYKCVELFITTDYTEGEIANLLNIGKSSVDRYLKDDEFISEIYKNKTSSIIKIIRKKLELNKVNGRIMGGVISQSVSPYEKDENGKFSGSKKI